MSLLLLCQPILSWSFCRPDVNDSLDLATPRTSQTALYVARSDGPQYKVLSPPLGRRLPIRLAKGLGIYE